MLPHRRGAHVHARLDHVLEDAVALARDEPFLGVPAGQVRLAHAHSGHGGERRGDIDEEIGPFRQGHLSRVLAPRRPPLGLHHRNVDQLERWAGHTGRGPGDRRGFRPSSAGLRVGRLRDGEEAPRRADQRPHADARRLGLAQPLEHSVAGVEAFVGDHSEAGVGVRRPRRQRPFDRRPGQIKHASRW
jgi:hypothetical protein